MPAARRTADPYADLPVALRRANLEQHRQQLLSDRHAQELHAQRLALFDDEAAAEKTAERVARIDELIAEADAQLEALPAEPDPPPGDADK